MARQEHRRVRERSNETKKKYEIKVKEEPNKRKEWTKEIGERVPTYIRTRDWAEGNYVLPRKKSAEHHADNYTSSPLSLVYLSLALIIPDVFAVFTLVSFTQNCTIFWLSPSICFHPTLSPVSHTIDPSSSPVIARFKFGEKDGKNHSYEIAKFSSIFCEIVRWFRNFSPIVVTSVPDRIYCELFGARSRYLSPVIFALPTSPVSHPRCRMRFSLDSIWGFFLSGESCMPYDTRLVSRWKQNPVEGLQVISIDRE